MKKVIASILITSSFIVSCNKDNKTLENVDFVLTKDSLETFKKLYEEAAYFSIDKNDQAQKQFAPRNVEDVMAKVVSDFTNHIKLNGESLLPVDKNGLICKVNKLSVLNNQWMIFDFYGEGVTGEMLFKYHYTPDKETSFEKLDIVIY